MAQALASFLRAQPLLGVDVASRRCVCVQYADDTRVFLGDYTPAAVDALLTALRTFAQATGQAVNVAKSAVVFVGALPEHLPSQLGGMPVRASAVHLGIPYLNPSLPPHRLHPVAHATRSTVRPLPQPPGTPPAPVSTAWEARLAATTRTLAMLARTPLSTFGRAMAASAYALPPLLYHAEFAGVPPSAAPRAPGDVAAASARAVGPGLQPRLLHGSPAQGGFGLLPLHHHTAARHAAMGARLVSALLPHPCAVFTPQPAASSPPCPRAA
jgi:hypothetical protein